MYSLLGCDLWDMPERTEACSFALIQFILQGTDKLVGDYENFKIQHSGQNFIVTLEVSVKNSD